MRAIILAAGRGSRLGADRPKGLVDLAGTPIIDRQIAVMRGAGIKDIVIVTGYRAELLARRGITTRHNAAWESTNMVESLFCAEDAFGDDVIVAYADIVYEPRVIAALVVSPHEVSVIVDRAWHPYWAARFDDPLADAESLRLDAAGRILDIGNKVARIDEIQAQYIGLTRFRGQGVAALRVARAAWDTTRRPWMERRPVAKAYMTDLLMELILRGISVYAVPVDGGWLEIDTPHDLELATALFAGGGPATLRPSRSMAGA